MFILLWIHQSENSKFLVSHFLKDGHAHQSHRLQTSAPAPAPWLPHASQPASPTGLSCVLSLWALCFCAWWTACMYTGTWKPHPVTFFVFNTVFARRSESTCGGQRSTLGVLLSHSLPYELRKGLSLSLEPGAHWFSSPAWPGSFTDLPVYAPAPPKPEVLMHATTPGFHVDTRDPNSGLYGPTVTPLPTATSSPSAFRLSPHHLQG